MQGYTEMVPKSCGMYTDPVCAQSVRGFSDEWFELKWTYWFTCLHAFPISANWSGGSLTNTWRTFWKFSSALTRFVHVSKEEGASVMMSNSLCPVSSAQNTSQKQLFTIKCGRISLRGACSFLKVWVWENNIWKVWDCENDGLHLCTSTGTVRRKNNMYLKF